MTTESYQICIDTGGTFTDCIGTKPNGELIRYKILSNGTLRGLIKKAVSKSILIIDESWKLNHDIIRGYSFRLLAEKYSACKIVSFNCKSGELVLDNNLPYLPKAGTSFEITAHEEAPVLGARLITATALDASFPPLELKLGSTKGTNALLEKKGAKTLLLITKGFRDLLKIGNQSRPNIFAMHVEKRIQLTYKIIEVNERIDAQGNVITPLDNEELSEIIMKEALTDTEAVAIALMNAYKNPQHEAAVKQLVESMGFKFISTSAALTPLIKLLPRAETAVVNAYLSPIIHDYVNNIIKSIGDCPFQIMTSAGSLVEARHFHPKDSLLSGPAGGVVGASIVGKQSGYEHLITFDMGGTSTDVSRYSNGFDYQFELEVGDSIINSSAVAIETVAAGGGSVCGYDGYRLFVGPESAGAYPGPACYGAGGPLTISDVNLLLGRLDTSKFGIPVFKEAAEQRLLELLKAIEARTGEAQHAPDVLHGFINIANEIMANAIRKISIAKGYKPNSFALLAFGGAGGLHACDIADILGIQTIILPKEAGLLSAFGIGNANIERFAEKQLLAPFEQIKHSLASHFLEIEGRAISLLKQAGYEESHLSIRQRMIFLRYKGQDSSIELPFTHENQLIDDFNKEYLKLFGHLAENRSIEVEAIRVIASVRNDKKMLEQINAPSGIIKPRLNNNGIPVYIREHLNKGDRFSGEALLLDNYSTSYLKPGWNLKIDEHGTAIFEKQKQTTDEALKLTHETELELFANRFMAIAENMGALLQPTALSVNIKERLDFSCALLDANGALVANAPHIPVHLGGLGVCVRTLMQHFDMLEGDTIVTNHPSYGGSHLPDVTMVSPIFYEGERIAFVVNRAHHSEIGGISPGSMPPNASNLEEEGVVIKPFYLVKKGKVDWNGMQQILLNAKYPSRAIEENLADLNAALAANKNGSDALLKLVRDHGSTTIQTYFEELKKHAANKCRETLSNFQNGCYTALEKLDDGSELKVKIDIDEGTCIIDFSGSAPVHHGNMNATIAIVNSVVIYVLRLLLKENIPLNDGLMEPVKLIVPHGLLNPEFSDDPSKCPAVVGGNVEISMRLTDTLLKAFGVMAASQETMNNTLFGNKNFGYYETICGGCGAGNGFDGADAVHHHMTNTRITDPEILEHRYPVRLEEFSIRENSGGKGKWHGGNGIRRKMTFLEAVNLSVLTQRRNSGPYALDGGADGRKGHQEIIRRNGETIPLASIQNIDLEPGDQFVIETPGGGGFGSKESV